MNYKSPLQRALVINDNDIPFEYQKSEISNNVSDPLSQCISVISGYETFYDFGHPVKRYIRKAIGINFWCEKYQAVYSCYSYELFSNKIHWLTDMYRNESHKIQIRPATQDEINIWKAKVSEIYNVQDIDDVKQMKSVSLLINKGDEIITNLEPIIKKK